MNLLGGVYLIRNELDRAGAVLEEALGIEREHFPANVEWRARLTNSPLSVCGPATSTEALAPAEESLALAIKTSGGDSLDAALAYTVVAEAHRLADRPERALPLFRRAQAIYEKELGPEHPRVASLLGQEGLMLAGERKLASAEHALQSALAMLDRSCPRCAYERWTIDCNFARVRILQGKYDAAEHLLTEALALSQSTQPEPPAEIAEVRKELADARRKQQHMALADRPR